MDGLLKKNAAPFGAFKQAQQEQCVLAEVLKKFHITFVLPGGKYMHT
jgi:hypothetical protein